MHHPVGFHPFGSSTSVEYKRLFQTYALGPVGGVDGSVSSGCLPKPGSSYPVRSCTVSVFSVSRAVEVPLFLPSSCQLFLYKYERKIKDQLV